MKSHCFRCPPWNRTINGVRHEIAPLTVSAMKSHRYRCPPWNRTVFGVRHEIAPFFIYNLENAVFHVQLKTFHVGCLVLLLFLYLYYSNWYVRCSDDYITEKRIIFLEIICPGNNNTSVRKISKITLFKKMCCNIFFLTVFRAPSELFLDFEVGKNRPKNGY